jgi:hypothetical protein
LNCLSVGLWEERLGAVGGVLCKQRIFILAEINFVKNSFVEHDFLYGDGKMSFEGRVRSVK